MRRLSVPFALVLLSACAPSTPLPPAAVGHAQPVRGPRAPAVDSRCQVVTRRLSALGRGGARPQVAAGTDAFAVAWEETTDHRAIFVATFDDQARPLGPSTELADLHRSGAEPRVVADGAEFLVLWTSEEEQGSVIRARHIDRTGRPVSDVQPLVTAPGARALAALALPDGYAVAWWNWAGTPHQIALSWFDRNDRPLGTPLLISRSPTPDPTVDLAVDQAPTAAAPAAGAGAPLRMAWEELVDGVPHVLAGVVDRTHVVSRADLGAGEAPDLGDGVVVWERPAENALQLAPVGAAASTPGGAAGSSIAIAHTPAAAARPGGGAVACFVRDSNREGGRTDRIWCGELDGARIVAPARVAEEPRGILSLQIAADRARTGVAWQAQEDDDTQVVFAVVSCRAPAAAPSSVASAPARR